jgi:hypothetical protein
LPKPKKKITGKKFAAGAAMYLFLFLAGKEKITGSDDDNICGGADRWDVKVMIDPAADSIDDSSPDGITIPTLHKIDTKKKFKYGENKPRMQVEKEVYTIRRCFITKILREDDNDLHLVLEDGKGNTMIAEAPDPECEDAKASDWVENFTKVRQFLLDHKSNYRHFRYKITGVAFVDKSHGAGGAAPNSIELHPILDIEIEKSIDLEPL